MPVPSKTEMELYCAIKSTQIRVICRTKQWSGIKEGEVTDWLYSNFKDIEGKYLAIKLLLHCLYYSEENIIELLRYGIYERILGTEIKDELIRTKNIYQTPSIMTAEVQKNSNRILFVPLLDNDKPSESGNAITRILSQKLNISSSNICFHFHLDQKNLADFDKIVIVDDCVGSGDQLNTFWNNTLCGIKEPAIKGGIQFYYLALVAYEKSIMEMQLDGYLKDLRVTICEILNEEHRIFSGKHIIWSDQAELDFANAYFDLVEKNTGTPKLGYGGLDFALFLHNSTPDWSLPIFWKETSQWKLLVKRKNSNS